MRPQRSFYVLIGKQEQLIATLREDRTATITHAVTKLETRPGCRDDRVWHSGTWAYSSSWWSQAVPALCTEPSGLSGGHAEKGDDGVLLVTARNVRQGRIDYGVSEKYVSADEYDEIMRRGLPQIDHLLFTMEAPLGNGGVPGAV